MKNIPRPVRIWVRGGDVAGAAAALEVPGFPRITIRPVQTSDTRAEARELAAALTGDLVFHLDSQRLCSARIVHEGRAEDYELAAILRAQGTRLRLEARLSAPDGSLLDLAKLDGDLSDAFDWQDSVALELAGQVLQRIVQFEAHSIEDIEEEKRSAEQWMLLAYERGAADWRGCRHFLECCGRALSLQAENGFLYGEA